jgi:hypothetical protein
MNLLDMSETEAFEEDKLYIATSDERSTSLGHVTWKAGDYIRYGMVRMVRILAQVAFDSI